VAILRNGAATLARLPACDISLRIDQSSTSAKTPADMPIDLLRIKLICEVFPSHMSKRKTGGCLLLELCRAQTSGWLSIISSQNDWQLQYDKIRTAIVRTLLFASKYLKHNLEINDAWCDVVHTS
jgi:hypothetical protein